MIKVAIVGTGIIGLTHLKAIENTNVCELCAVCDINEEKARGCAEKYGVPYFTDYHDIPKKTDADAVILNLPHFLHCESVVFFLESGLHVLVEKPMANTTEECDRMIAATEKSGKVLVVGHTQRYFKVNQFIKEAIKEERYGKLSMITGVRSINYFLESRPKWFLSKKMAGGGIGMNYGAHALDTLFYIIGESNPEILSNYGNLKNDADIEGHMQYFLKFPSGISMAETLSGYNASGHELIYYFTDGVLKVDNAQVLYERKNSQWEMIDVQEDGAKMERQLLDFCNCLDGKPNMICTMYEGREVIAALEKLYKSV